jgi:4-carboxymuconolactone decarboxylase
MDFADDRYRRGISVLRALSGESIEQVTNKVAEIAPDFARMTIEFPFGDLYSRGILDLKTREAAAISSLAALGRIPQLRVHVTAALNLGMSRTQIVELLMQVSIYAGFPPALNALAECHDLLIEKDERTAK